MRIPPRVWQFARFLVVGVLATGVQYVVLIIGVEFMHQNATPSSTVGFVIGAIVNYVLNYHFTFSSGAPHALAMARFTVIATGGLLLTAVLMWLLTNHSPLQYVVAQILTSCVVLAWNYCGNAFWSFAIPADGKAEQLAVQEKSGT